ncbi:ARE2 [[Candida] subhashii]|uniref:O-acyltransferase n=1 Tax=[Candida] subhashii TaxID=561895 RepID=A0A8J5UM82_9ASCO|nr:ARE2 [[Candida] subhashii]KAG7663136.1 ARE2 [[Candida] subhashii]
MSTNQAKIKRSETADNLDHISRINTFRQFLDINNDYASSESSEEDNKSDTTLESITKEEVENNNLEQELKQRKKVTTTKTTTTKGPEGIITLDRLVTRVSKLEKSRINKKPSSKAKYVSRFGDIKFKTKSTTIFDSESFKQGQFFGFYILFWLATAFFMFNNFVHTYFENELSILEWPIVQILLRDVIKVGLIDLAMYLSSYFPLLVQLGCKYNIITWNNSGWLLQGVYDGVFIFFWIWIASNHVMDFPWIAKVYLLLHSLVMVMKMHSYGFYNGYLWAIYNEALFAENYQDRLSKGQPLPNGFKHEDTTKLLQNSIEFCKYELECQTKINSDNFEEFDQKSASDHMNLSIKELQQQGHINFPNNINLFNYFEYSMFPTVVYTLNYPRTEKINWYLVFDKVCAIFGIIFLMIYIAQWSMYPLFEEALIARELPIAERIPQFFYILFDMMLPFLMIYMFTFYLIWDSILSAIAELSMFADREFYGPWWNCSDFSEFARLWNIPVHKFLLRHVYHSSISALTMNKHQATLFTFVLSSLVHELVMYVIFGNLRGYLLLLQMSQIPLVMLCRSKMLRGKKIFGNVLCWTGFILGPSVILISYLLF